jgi:hypothetical protein
MVMIRSRRRISGKQIGDCQKVNIPNRNFGDKLLPGRHHMRSPGYVWMIISGPDYIIGRIFPEHVIRYGGWCNDIIVAQNIRNGKILQLVDSVEAVI